MKRRILHILFIMLAVTMLSFAYADFPYSAQWLNYADMRIVYQVDTSSITSNTADIYAIIDINATLLQDYINRWSDYCDPISRYDWFYPTFTYASTANQTERPLQVVSYQNWQTFVVGTCGDVNLPTRYVVKLTDGVLDGGADFATYQHYIYAYLKYPFAEDFSDDPVGLAPAGWQPADTSSASIIAFYSSVDYPYYSYVIDAGHTFRAPDGGTFDRDLTFQINLDDTTPTFVCASQGGYNPDISFMINGTWYHVVTIDDYSRTCVDAEAALHNSGLSGNVIVQRIRYSQFGNPTTYWLWIIPDSLYSAIVSR